MLDKFIKLTGIIKELFEKMVEILENAMLKVQLWNK
jgi:hypothetical protein